MLKIEHIGIAVKSLENSYDESKAKCERPKKKAALCATAETEAACGRTARL